MNPPMLALPDMSKSFIVETDASSSSSINVGRTSNCINQQGLETKATCFIHLREGNVGNPSGPMPELEASVVYGEDPSRLGPAMLVLNTC